MTENTITAENHSLTCAVRVGVLMALLSSVLLGIGGAIQFWDELKAAMHTATYVFSFGGHFIVGVLWNLAGVAFCLYVACTVEHVTKEERGQSQSTVLWTTNAPPHYTRNAKLALIALLLAIFGWIAALDVAVAPVSALGIASVFLCILLSVIAIASHIGMWVTIDSANEAAKKMRPEVSANRPESL